MRRREKYIPEKSVLLLLVFLTMLIEGRSRTSVLHASLAGIGTPTTATNELKSVDIRGNCSYVKGAPTTPGGTIEKDKGRTIELIAHGTEFGHHCGEDQGRFAFTLLTGDFDITVQVASVTNHGAKHFYDQASTLAKAGIMAREGNAPGDRYVAIWAVSNDALDHSHDAFHFDLRKLAGAWLGNAPPGCKNPHTCPEGCPFVYGFINARKPNPDLFFRNFPNVWLRLQRKENKFLAMVSKDGKLWHPTSQPDHEIEFADQLFVGVAVSAAAEGKFDQRAEAVFRNIEGVH